MPAVKTITVRRLYSWRFSMNANEILLNVDIIKDLKSKGVPIIGAISISGVEHGELKMFTEEDLNGMEFVYEWTGVPDKPPTWLAPKAAIEEEEETL